MVDTSSGKSLLPEASKILATSSEGASRFLRSVEPSLTDSSEMFSGALLDTSMMSMTLAEVARRWSRSKEVASMSEEAPSLGFLRSLAASLSLTRLLLAALAARSSEGFEIAFLVFRVVFFPDPFLDEALPIFFDDLFFC